MNNIASHKNSQNIFNRRTFLKYLSLSAAGLFIPPDLLSGAEKLWSVDEKNLLFGRVTLPGHKLHLKPDPDSEILEEMDMDSVWRITGVRIEEGVRNPIWFELDGSGYAHSRSIQPVKKLYNTPAMNIPEGGCLGEITVPYVDAYRSMASQGSVVYRLYYLSTFWVLSSKVDQEGVVWYQLLDDRNYGKFFIPAKHMRMVPESELTPITPQTLPENKSIIVDLTEQILTAYENDQPVFRTKISSGIRLLEGGFATPKGHYRIIRKRPCRHMANPPNAFGSGFDLPGVPWVSYFTSDGVGFHGTYWHNDFGIPHSHGCINMTSQTAKWLYRWTTPAVPAEEYFYSGMDGTRVLIQ
jgi:hypothetical protein